MKGLVLFSIKNIHLLNLFSHIIGQVDYDNYGVSNEKYFDKELKDKNLSNNQFKLTLDMNIQHLISKMTKALKTFKATVEHLYF